MAKVNELLTSRFKKASEKLNKMTSLAEMSTSGNLSSFSGVFRINPLSEKETEELRDLLDEYSEKPQDVSIDLQQLSAITSEVKAINNQAAILHGERIKRAQVILKKYRDGAFSSWMMRTYGNRQTPYNFLQYYELYTSIPKLLQPKMDEMPRQAIYTLATRSCPQEEKEKVIENYQGETKQELLTLIRQKFPLNSQDKRAINYAENALKELKIAAKMLQHKQCKPTPTQKKRINEVLQSIQEML